MTSITSDDEVTNEVGVRFGKAERAFRYVQSSIFETGHLLYRITEVSIVLWRVLLCCMDQRHGRGRFLV